MEKLENKCVIPFYVQICSFVVIILIRENFCSSKGEILTSVFTRVSCFNLLNIFNILAHTNIEIYLNM